MSRAQGKVWRNTESHLLINTKQMKMVLNIFYVLDPSNIHMYKILLLRISLPQENSREKEYNTFN